MNLQKNGFWSAAVLVVLTAALSAQTPAQPQGAQNPNFRVQVDLVTTDVLVRDDKGNFIPDLKSEDFEVYEDGVLQDISSMTVFTGGRVTNLLLPPPAPPPEGVILPPSKPGPATSRAAFSCSSSTISICSSTTRAASASCSRRFRRNCSTRATCSGIVSSGPSSLSIQMTYDKNRLQDAIKKMTGNELKPDDIINGPSGPGGPSEIRYRARVAFSTVEETLKNLEQVHNRPQGAGLCERRLRFYPVPNARLGLMDPSSPFAQNQLAQSQNAARRTGESTATDPPDPTRDMEG